MEAEKKGNMEIIRNLLRVSNSIKKIYGNEIRQGNIKCSTLCCGVIGLCELFICDYFFRNLLKNIAQYF